MLRLLLRMYKRLEASASDDDNASNGDFGTG